MRAVVQRVRRGSVAVEGEVIGRCGPGFVVLLGVGQGDSSKQAEYIAQKILNMRVFEDTQGKMNLAALDLEPPAEILLISQFTLYADTRRGRRPGFSEAALPEVAAPLVEYVVALLKKAGLSVETGRFGADMLVTLENDGPVTIILDTADAP